MKHDAKLIKKIADEVQSAHGLSGLSDRPYFDFAKDVAKKYAAEMINEKNKELTIVRRCFDDTIWMAIRYAHGRHTYAPGMVRDAIKDFKEIFPEWKMRPDQVIKAPEAGDHWINSGDYLNDLFYKDDTDIET